MISSRVKDALDSWDFRDATAEEYDAFYAALAAVVEALETYTQDSPHTRASKALRELERALGECGV